MRGAISALVHFALVMHHPLAGAKRCRCSSLYIGCTCTTCTEVQNTHLHHAKK